MNPKPFEILGHTADLRLRVTGKTEEELFRNALRGMASIQSPQASKPISPKAKKREVKVQSPDVSALLIDFLNEVLYLSNVSKEVYVDVAFSKFSGIELEGELSGVPVEKFDKDIKAATYHEAEVKQNEEGFYEATVIVDI
ncbi:MAG: archease [Parcubacteria group bacterium]|nr:archease [Parcubacteria group bacterium]